MLEPAYILDRYWMDDLEIYSSDYGITLRSPQVPSKNLRGERLPRRIDRPADVFCPFRLFFPGLVFLVNYVL